MKFVQCLMMTGRLMMTCRLMMAGALVLLAGNGAFAAGEEGAERTIPVVIKTTLGEIDLALYPDRAPVTVENFLNNMQAGLYKGGLFYRAVRLDNQRPADTTITLIQGGRNRALAPRPPIAHETTAQTGIPHRNGVISMARLDPGTADSEFFICVGDNPALDYGSPRNPDRQGYASFGVVTAGMEVVLKIQRQSTTAPVEDPDSPVRNQILSQPVKILDITRR